MPGLYMQCPCGESIGKNRWRRGKRTCTACGIARGVTVSREMYEKSGATYEHWRAQMLKSLLGNESSMGDSENGDPGESSEHH